MLILNIDVSDGLANGACGTVVGFDNTGDNVHVILVDFDSRRVGTKAIAESQYRQSYPTAVPIKRHEVQFFTGRGRRSVQAKRTQFPLTLAWACTIHKVQGKTLDTIVVSMKGRGRFMPGQAYVAVSRVRTERGLYLQGFDATAFRVNPAVEEEMRRLRQNLVQPIQAPVVFPHEEWLNIRLLNVRSYLEHLEDLKHDATLTSTDIFCFVETFLREGRRLQGSEHILQDANCFRADRPSSSGRGGGILTFAAEELSPLPLNISIHGLEYLALTVTKQTTQVNIVTIYRPPSMSTASFFEKFKHLVDLLQKDITTVIMGDFNVDLLQYPDHTIVRYMNTIGFYQLVSDATTDYGSMLDHVYVNRRDHVHVEIADTYYSDHDLVCVSLKVT